MHSRYLYQQPSRYLYQQPSRYLCQFFGLRHIFSTLQTGTYICLRIHNNLIKLELEKQMHLCSWFICNAEFNQAKRDLFKYGSGSEDSSRPFFFLFDFSSSFEMVASVPSSSSFFFSAGFFSSSCFDSAVIFVRQFFCCFLNFHKHLCL